MERILLQPVRGPQRRGPYRCTYENLSGAAAVWNIADYYSSNIVQLGRVQSLQSIAVLVGSAESPFLARAINASPLVVRERQQAVAVQNVLNLLWCSPAIIGKTNARQQCEGRPAAFGGTNQDSDRRRVRPWVHG